MLSYSAFLIEWSAHLLRSRPDGTFSCKFATYNPFPIKDARLVSLSRIGDGLCSAAGSAVRIELLANATFAGEWPTNGFGGRSDRALGYMRTCGSVHLQLIELSG